MKPGSHTPQAERTATAGEAAAAAAVAVAATGAVEEAKDDAQLPLPLPLLPSGLCEYQHQVGGRGLLFWRKLPILSGQSGDLYKPVQRPPKGRREVAFYRHVAAATDSAAILLDGLRPFLADFLGVFRDGGTGQLYLGLGDALHQLRRPCVMDCKIGGLSTPPGAPVSKRLLQRAMYVHRGQLGFIITGFRVHEAGRSEARVCSILHGRSLDTEGVYCKGLRPFLMAAGSSARAGRVAAEVSRRLEQLQAWFAVQRAFRFYASSLLIAFESLQPDDEPHVVVRAVDFAHVHRCPGGGSDENYLSGLRKLTAYFRRGATELSGADGGRLTLPMSDP